MSSHIWRYIDLAKLIHLAANRTLHFTRIDQFKDKFEGSYPIGNLKDWEYKYPGVGDFSGWRKFACVSCWYESENESAAMWELYSRSGQGMAIRSTKDKLKDSLLFAEEVFFSNVKYIDFLRDKADISTPLEVFLYKRIEFASEREFRAALFDLPGCEEFKDGFPILGSVEKQEGFPKNGKDMPVKPEVLIEKVILSPYSKPWYKEMVKDVLGKYDLSSLGLLDSELMADPVYPKQ
jgi:hypothetical protein